MNDREKGAVIDSNNSILEIYRIHVEMVDRVSQRREGANRLFVTLLSATMLLIVAMLRFGSGMESIPIECIVSILTIAVLCLSISWAIVIRSYRQLNTGKFDVLHELEKQLPFAFYTLEWESLQKGKSPSRYWKLTVVENALPVVFSLLSIAVCVLVFTLS